MRCSGGRTSGSGASISNRWSSLSSPIRSAWLASSQSWSSDATQNTGITGRPSDASNVSASRTAVIALCTL